MCLCLNYANAEALYSYETISFFKSELYKSKFKGQDDYRKQDVTNDRTT